MTALDFGPECTDLRHIDLYVINKQKHTYPCFSDELRWTKTEHSDVAMYGGRIHVYIFFLVQLFGLCLISLLRITVQGFSETWIRMLLFIYYVQISTFWTEIQGCHLTRLV